MVVSNHTAPARSRAPAMVHFPNFIAAHTARRRANVGTRPDGSS